MSLLLFNGLRLDSVMLSISVEVPFGKLSVRTIRHPFFRVVNYIYRFLGEAPDEVKQGAWLTFKAELILRQISLLCRFKSRKTSS